MPFSVGEPVPWFSGPTGQSSRFHFSSVAGRYVVVCLFGSLSEPRTAAVMQGFASCRDRFDDQRGLFFGVSVDPADEQSGRLREVLPGIRHFRDFDGEISRQLRATQSAATVPQNIGAQPSASPLAALQEGCYRQATLVLDERLRVVADIPFDTPETHVARVLDVFDRLPPMGAPRQAAVQAPILVVPRVFEPELCRRLIGMYEQHGGEDSGFMRDEGGKTVGIIDYSHKRRSDYQIDDESIRRQCMYRIHDRLVPEIEKAYQFKATRMERYIVACYESASGGHFRAHRDNTTRGTAHRRFAVSLHLNSEEYEGGDLRFPEFGPHLYRAPTGGAVVFSCSLLHEATPVTSGMRYVFLPFLYDDAAARIRDENARYLSGTVQHVEASFPTAARS